MPSGLRLQRIADRIRQEISDMLIREINDPRLKLIYITDVKVDKELAYADVYVSALEGHTRSAEILAGMESASGFCAGLWPTALNSVFSHACASTGTPHPRTPITSKRFWLTCARKENLKKSSNISVIQNDWKIRYKDKRA